jgi:hypothetical protein
MASRHRALGRASFYVLGSSPYPIGYQQVVTDRGDKV